MKLISVSLTNFRSYKGDHTIDFTGYEDGRNVFSIWAVNNAGKSKLVDAIRWCFYGVNSESTGGAWVSPLNADIWNDDSESMDFIVAVKFEFNGSHFQVKRGKTNIQKLDRQGVSSAVARDSISREKFEDISRNVLVYRLNDDGTVDHDRAFGEDFINQRFPLSLSKYFFLSGEFLSSDPVEERKTRPQLVAQLKYVVGLTYYEAAKKSAADLLQQASNELARKASGVNGAKIQQKNDELNALERQKIADEKLISQLKNENAASLTEIGELEELIKARHDAIPIIEEIRESAKEEKALEKYKTELAGRQLEIFTTRSYLLLLSKTFNKFDKIQSKHVKNQDLPVHITKDLLSKIKADELCICGREVHDGTHEMESIDGHLRKAVMAGSADEWAILDLRVAQARVEADALKTELEQIQKSLSSNNREIGALRVKQKRAEKKLTDLNFDASGSDLDQFESQVARRAVLDTLVRKNDERIRDLNLQLSDWVRQAANIKKEILDLSNGQTELQKYQRRVSKLQNVKDYIDSVYSKREELLLPTLRNYFDSYFKEMTPIPNRTAQLKDDLSWRSIATNDRGQEVDVDEGGGITQALRIAILLAMLRVARDWAKLDQRVKVVDYDLPIVLDAPLGQLQGDMANKLVTTVANSSGQVIILGNEGQFKPVETLLRQLSYRQIYLSYHTLRSGNSELSEPLSLDVYGKTYHFRIPDQDTGIGYVEVGGDIV